GAAAEGRGRDRAAVDCRWRGQADADEELKPKGPVGRPCRARVRIAARITRARFVNQSRIDAPEKDTRSPRSATSPRSTCRSSTRRSPRTGTVSESGGKNYGRHLASPSGGSVLSDLRGSVDHRPYLGPSAHPADRPVRQRKNPRSGSKPDR